MSTTNDVIRGAIKLDNFMEGKCFTSWQDFVLALPSMLSVEVPGSITNVNVGNVQPTDDQRDHLWIRTDNAGSFLGLYIYAQGAWQQIYPAPNEIFLIRGDSRSVPAGYQLASDDPNLTNAEVTALKKIWSIGGTVPTTWYTVFHVTYIGF